MAKRFCLQLVLVIFLKLVDSKYLAHWTAADVANIVITRLLMFDFFILFFHAGWGSSTTASPCPPALSDQTTLQRTSDRLQNRMAEFCVYQVLQRSLARGFRAQAWSAMNSIGPSFVSNLRIRCANPQQNSPPISAKTASPAEIRSQRFSLAWMAWWNASCVPKPCWSD